MQDNIKPTNKIPAKKIYFTINYIHLINKAY